MTQKYNGLINNSLEDISNIILKMHLQGFNLDKAEREKYQKIIIEEFDRIRDLHPDYIKEIIWGEV